MVDFDKPDVNKPMSRNRSTKTPLSFKKRMMRLAVSVGRIYLLTCAVLYWQQARFIFMPTRTVEETPTDYQLAYENVELSIFATHLFGKRREKIHGWWIPAQKSNAKTILYFHGNGVNIGANTGQASRFHRLGFSVFLFDYRGYGQSEGDFPSEAAVYRDAQRAWVYLTQERKIPPENIVLYGHSLGGAIAINLATQHPNAAGLIVQSSFTSALDMARRNWWTAIFPVNVLLNQRFASIEKVPSLKMPTLYIHGTIDQTIPFKMSERLFAATRSTKHIQLVKGANHNDVSAIGGAAYSQTIQDFVAQAERTACKDCAGTQQVRQSGSAATPIFR
jgi:uncharacterized protein